MTIATTALFLFFGMLLGAEGLIAEEQDAVLGQRLVHLLEGRAIQRAREVNAVGGAHPEPTCQP